MTNTDQFILGVLCTDGLPDSYTLGQAQQLVRAALEHSTDLQSAVDEERIRNLRAALQKIEDTTTDTIAGLTARNARIQDDD